MLCVLDTGAIEVKINLITDQKQRMEFLFSRKINQSDMKSFTPTTDLS